MILQYHKRKRSLWTVLAELLDPVRLIDVEFRQIPPLTTVWAEDARKLAYDLIRSTTGQSPDESKQRL